MHIKIENNMDSSMITDTTDYLMDLLLPFKNVTFIIPTP
jgi:hypothetical protein